MIFDYLFWMLQYFQHNFFVLGKYNPYHLAR